MKDVEREGLWIDTRWASGSKPQESRHVPSRRSYSLLYIIHENYTRKADINRCLTPPAPALIFISHKDVLYENNVARCAKSLSIMRWHPLPDKRYWIITKRATTLICCGECVRIWGERLVCRCEMPLYSVNGVVYAATSQYTAFIWGFNMNLLRVYATFQIYAIYFIIEKHQH